MTLLRLPSRARAYRVLRAPLLVVRERDPSRARPRLLDAIRPSVLRALTADRAEAYVEILVAMLTMRRAHELAPLLEDLRRRVSADEASFLRDLLQLEAWGCVSRQFEPLRIRGYSDASRERFRYRLTDDTVAVLTWLETRLEARNDVPRSDARDRLGDLLGRARELGRACAPNEASVEPRRAVHLFLAIDDEIRLIAEDLIALRAEMHRFARTTFDSESLARIVAGLDQYVADYVLDVRALRAEVLEAIRALTTTAVAERIARHRAELSAHALTSPRASGRDQEPFAIPDPDEQIRSWEGFFAEAGGLALLSAHVEDAAREVVAKLRAHVAALERQGDRSDVLGQAIVRVAREEDRHAAIVSRLWGHPLPTWAPGPEGGPLVPPLPRRRSTRALGEAPILEEKRTRREAVRELRGAKVRELACWLRAVGLVRDDEVVRLSAARADGLRSGDAAAAWMAVARARHLGRGAGLEELGVRIEPIGGAASLGARSEGLTSPDCLVRGRA